MANVSRHIHQLVLMLGVCFLFAGMHQEDSSQTVRVWGDTAVVTALLWAKGTESGKAFEYRLWFSDLYVRTPSGWRYVLGQAAQPLAQ
jgi:hypothetical protein